MTIDAVYEFVKAGTCQNSLWVPMRWNMKKVRTLPSINYPTRRLMERICVVEQRSRVMTKDSTFERDDKESVRGVEQGRINFNFLEKFNFYCEKTWSSAFKSGLSG